MDTYRNVTHYWTTFFFQNVTEPVENKFIIKDNYSLTNPLNMKVTGNFLETLLIT